MSREDILLKEYEICQQDSSSMVSAHWTVVGIFIGINTALLGAVAYMLNNGSYSNNIRWIVISLGLASIGILVCLCLWLNRVNFLVCINNRRMYQIERELGMAKNRLQKDMDKKELRKKLRKFCKFFPCIPSDGACPIKGVYTIYILLWIFLIIAAFSPCI